MRKIDSVDFFYLSMPEVTTEGDGSQDALLVRVSAGGLVGWGECEASPLVSIAAFVCPMSHGACRPVQDSVLGQRIEGPEDILRIASKIQLDSMDLLQAPHTWSGIEIALWDLLGKSRGEPVWKMLGYREAFGKLPYASQLFGETPEQTHQRALAARKNNYRAVKFGWGPFGRAGLHADIAQLTAAREGLGQDCLLMIDVGQIFGENVEAAADRLPALRQIDAFWLEEPFHSSALVQYASLADRGGKIRLAGGEGAHNFSMAAHLIDYGKLSYIQIDSGRIGGIGAAKGVADFAVSRGVTFVNHTFTSHLALSASLQPYAGLRQHEICEYPFSPKPLAWDLTSNHLERDRGGYVKAPDAPGLGITIDREKARRYLVDVEIRVKGKNLFSSSHDL
ncbi:MAG TPA: mandelate racemase/muconate lactonizing enzyme family protein [Terriglobales bacterium]|nr:mandelate racemase/muconate lactonizing enzyme family protein [Terriglobales bacterium]